jgi:hypothetical protein
MCDPSRAGAVVWIAGEYRYRASSESCQCFDGSDRDSRNDHRT